APYLVAEKEGEWPKGALEQSVDLALPRGVVVRGKVVEEGTGRPVAGAVVRIAPYRSPQQIAGGSCVVAASGSDGTYRVAAPPRGGWKSVGVAPTGGGRGQVRDGRFTLHGLDADVEVPAFFLEPERKLGATVRFSGRSGSGEPVTVRLESCGTARARLVDPEG